MSGNPLVLFDGVCGLCDRFVQLLLKADNAHIFKFAPLQGSTAANVLARHPALPAAPQSVILVVNFNEPDEMLFTQSEAVLRIAKLLGGAWRVFSWLRIVPPVVRDAIYQWIARHRYAWFGKFEECKIPSAETRTRFLP